MNTFNFTGNLPRDAEQKFLPNGDSIVSFSVAVKSGYGEKAKTSWARCSMFGKRGEAVLQYLMKGQLVGVCGELTLNEFTNKDGNKQSSLEVRVNDLTLLGGKKEGESQSRPAQQQSGGSFDNLSDDIPFSQIGRGMSFHVI